VCEIQIALRINTLFHIRVSVSTAVELDHIWKQFCISFHYTSATVIW